MLVVSLDWLSCTCLRNLQRTAEVEIVMATAPVTLGIAVQFRHTKIDHEWIVTKSLQPKHTIVL